MMRISVSMLFHFCGTSFFFLVHNCVNTLCEVVLSLCSVAATKMLTANREGGGAVERGVHPPIRVSGSR